MNALAGPSGAGDVVLLEEDCPQVGGVSGACTSDLLEKLYDWEHELGLH
ncbi:hypothetical protein [Archangium gephyra]|uniref:Uncharacterized protein n=1 Tax=Archangium gephyra TaxID=48 RepID=A0AAC8TJX9_9BACT|nr:hypothetical protein [Archangium gephyra]AKJ07246.1 Hypothetical protein AA314_08872 [Archangium gephyra]